MRLSKAGDYAGESAFGARPDDAVFEIAPGTPSGFVLATGQGVVKTDGALNLQWRAGHEPADGSYLPDLYRAVVQVLGGGYLAVGDRRGDCGGDPCPADLVLTRFDEAGGITWQQVWGDGGAAPDSGQDLAITPDGGCVIAGFTASHGQGGTDLWVIKAAPDGSLEWDLCLGGEGFDLGHSVAVAPDDTYFAAGSAEVEGVSTMWVVKVRSDLHNGEHPSKAYRPASNDREARSGDVFTEYLLSGCPEYARIFRL